MNGNLALKIIDGLGEQFFLQDLEWTERSLRHARTSGKIAGRWYRLVLEACVEQGIPCPMDAFTWAEPDKKDGGGLEQFQGATDDARL